MEFVCQCPNGHHVRVEERHRGHRVRCRKCRAVFRVPPAEPSKPLTESAVLRILGDFEPREARPRVRSHSPFTIADERECPRCHANVSVFVRVCPHCNLYLSTLPDSAAG